MTEQVKKEDVLKLNITNLDIFKHDKSLSKSERKTLMYLSIVVDLKNFPKYVPVNTIMWSLGIKELNKISLEDLSNISNKADNLEKLSIDVILDGIKKLKEKGHIIRDTDGRLAFAQGSEA